MALSDAPELQPPTRSPRSALLLALAALALAPRAGAQEPGDALEAPEQQSLEEDQAVEEKLEQALGEAHDPLNTEDGETLELALEQALQIALSNDLRLEISELATDVARFTAAGSWGAFDPVLTAGGSYEDNEFEGDSSLAGADVLEESNWNFDTGLLLPVETGGTFQLGFAHSNQLTNNQFTFVNPSTTDLLSLSFTQPLLRGGWHEYATSQQKLARLEYKKQIERTREARRLLLLDVTNTYWDVVAAREELRVAGITHELAKRQLEQNQRRLEAGVGTEVEVLQAEANVAVRVQEALDAKVGVAEAVDALKRILFPGTDGRTWSYEILPVTPIPEPGSDPATSWRAALAVALEERAELALQRYEIEASEVRLAQTESEQRPALDLILSANGRGFDGDPEEAIGEALGLDFPSTSAGLRFSFPLLNRTARNAYFAARSALRSAHLVYDQLETRVASEVRTSLRQVLYQAQALEAARVSLDLAGRQLEAEEARLREGLSTTFTVLEFQRELAAALSSETAARVAYAKALAALLAAQGRLDTELH